MAKKNGQWAHTLAEGKRRRLIHAELATGWRVVVRSLTLDELVALDALPDDLVHIALLELAPGGVPAAIAEELRKGTPESTERARKFSHDQNELRDRLVLAAVVDPKLAVDDLADLDSFDKVMIAEIAQHKLAYDAAGRRIGPEPLDTFRVHGEKHGCPPDCAQCEEARLELSAVHG